MTDTSPIKWRSKFFPDMVLTEKHLEILKYAYPSLGKIEPHLKDAEVWLFDHPDRRPKKLWNVFISNWMKTAARIQAEREARTRPEQGDAMKQTPGDAKIIGNIMRKAMEG